MISMSKTRRPQLSHPQSLPSQLAAGRARILLPGSQASVPKALWWHVRNICKKKHYTYTLSLVHIVPLFADCDFWICWFPTLTFLLTRPSWGLSLAAPVNGDLVLHLRLSTAPSVTWVSHLTSWVSFSFLFFFCNGRKWHPHLFSDLSSFHPPLSHYWFLSFNTSLLNAYQALNVGLDCIALQTELGIKAMVSRCGEPPLYLFDPGQVMHHDYFFSKNLLAAPHSVHDLSSPIRIKPVPPAVEMWSLNHWTTREVLTIFLLVLRWNSHK